MNNELKRFGANIKVIGVGGGGNNAVNRMSILGLEGVEFWVANTDAQVLYNSHVQNKITLGPDVTKGLGAGADPEIGRKAAINSENEIKEALQGADMVFIAAGMGGGTGTGAAPIIASIAKDLGALTIGVVTRPFDFEGKIRHAFASEGIEKLSKVVDSLIVISNEQLLQMIGNRPLSESFIEADNILRHSVRTITDLILKPALINLDFADVRTIMKNKGAALIGLGEGSGENKAKEAALNAVTSPLLESKIRGARSAIVNVTGGKTVTLIDANEAVAIIRESTGNNENLNLIFGVSVDEELGDKMCVTVIATDLSNDFSFATSKDSNVTNINAALEERLHRLDGLNSNVSLNNDESKKEEKDDSLLPPFLRRNK